MSDTPLFDPDDRVDDIEALLRELDESDLELVAPPADLWTGIDDAVRAEEGAEVVAITSRRSRFSSKFLGAVAAVAIIAVGAVAVTSIGGDGGEVLATAELAYDPSAFDPLGADATATARLVETDDGFEIELEETTLPSDLGEPADLELWLIETDSDGNITDIASVALVEGSGTYAVPASIDVTSHRIVDISVEPRNGDATHSSRSILRGSLDA